MKNLHENWEGDRCEMCNERKDSLVGVSVKLGRAFDGETCTMFICDSCKKQRDERLKNDKA